MAPSFPTSARIDELFAKLRASDPVWDQFNHDDINAMGLKWRSEMLATLLASVNWQPVTFLNATTTWTETAGRSPMAVEIAMVAYTDTLLVRAGGQWSPSKRAIDLPRLQGRSQLDRLTVSETLLRGGTPRVQKVSARYREDVVELHSTGPEHSDLAAFYPSLLNDLA